MKEDKQMEKPKNKLPRPRIDAGIRRFLTSEEARISSKSIIQASVTLFFLGVVSENAVAGTHSSHSVFGSAHSSTAGHGNTTTHANDGDTGHTSIAPHASAAPHASDASLGVSHVSGHSNGGLNEPVTKGELHNDATANYGKHSAGTGHYNLPNLFNRPIDVSGDGHASTTPHSNTITHQNVGHSVSPTNHNSLPMHQSMHANGDDGHSSHGSHGQW